MFDRIAPNYDLLNRIISWGQDQAWRRNLAEKMDLQSGQVVLDISAGTGDMEDALKKACPSVRVMGLDPSRLMLSLYRKKFTQSNLLQNCAESIPIKDESVLRIVCAFGIRNFQNRLRAFEEIHRVLKPGGLWGFVEMSAPNGALFSLFYSLYFKRIVPLIGRLISHDPGAYNYLPRSVYEFPNLPTITEEHHQSGFSLVHYKPILQGAVGIYIFQRE